MSASDTLERLRRVIADVLQVQPARVEEGSTFSDDLGADSLDTANLLMHMEREFDIDIPDEAAEKMATVKDAVSYIDAREHR